MTEDGGTTRRVAGRYRLERRIGRGGAGAVWRAHDERLDRPVAVKQIPIAPDAEASSRDRALREARAAARLRVPTVVQVYDVIEEDGHAYLIMELVDAPNLSTLVRRHGPLEAPKVAAMGLQILDALEAAHRVGILHRDVKPSNVLIDHDTPRLTDFGIARVGDDPALTTTGVVMGTPAYIAPEHARGEEIGPAVDLYGLGATLYYAVEGESPFGAKDSLSTVMAVVTAPPRPMTRAGALTDLLTDLLDKKPAARPEPEEIRRRLNRVVKSSRPAHARAATISAPGSGTSEHDAAPAIGDESVPAGISDVDPDRDAEPTDELRRTTPTDREEPVDPTVPAGGQQPAGRTARRNDRRPALFAIVVVLALAALISMRTLADGDSGRTDDRQPGSEPAPAAARGTEPAAAAPTPTQSAAAPAPSEPSSQPSEAGGDANASETTKPTPDAGDGVLPATDAEVPRDWVEYAPDHAPYRVSYPPDWEIVSVDGTRTDIRDPDSGTYLRLDWVDERRDPVGAWEAYEPAFASSHSGYERIRITPTRYKGNRAALWEYRYEDGGVRLHAYNLGVNAGDQGFALNMQSHDSDWERAQRLWPYFLSSYEFTGS